MYELKRKSTYLVFHFTKKIEYQPPGVAAWLKSGVASSRTEIFEDPFCVAAPLKMYPHSTHFVATLRNGYDHSAHK